MHERPGNGGGRGGSILGFRGPTRSNPVRLHPRFRRAQAVGFEPVGLRPLPGWEFIREGVQESSLARTRAVITSL